MSIKPVQNQPVYTIAFAILVFSVVVFVLLFCTFQVQGQVNIVSGIRTPTPAKLTQSDAKKTQSDAKPEQSILHQAEVSRKGLENAVAGKPLRSRIKVVVYSMDHCLPCVKLHEDIERILPAQGWKLGTANGHVEACQSDADIVFVHHPAGEELFNSYPTVCVYSNGRFIRRYYGGITAAQVARRWLDQYEAELSQ